jgi:hypothetical protein
MSCRAARSVLAPKGLAYRGIVPAVERRPILPLLSGGSWDRPKSALRTRTRTLLPEIQGNRTRIFVSRILFLLLACYPSLVIIIFRLAAAQRETGEIQPHPSTGPGRQHDTRTLSQPRSPRHSNSLDGTIGQSFSTALLRGPLHRPERWLHFDQRDLPGFQLARPRIIFNRYRLSFPLGTCASCIRPALDALTRASLSIQWVLAVLPSCISHANRFTSTKKPSSGHLERLGPTISSPRGKPAL